MAEVETAKPVSSDWKSPLRKLVRFFERSRDQWKNKHQKMKVEHKLMSNQVRAVENSRERWAKKAKEAQRQVRRLQREVDEPKKSLSPA